MSGRLLVAYSNSSNHVAATAEYLDAIARYSSCDVRYAHVTHDARLDFDLNEFDAVFNSYCARLCFEKYVSGDYIGRLKSFRGVKLLAVQDEYDRTDTLKRAIREIGFHVVFTCVPYNQMELVFPRAMFPGTEFINVLTGYVPDHLVERGAKVAPLAERPIYIGYRARDLGGRYGRLGFLKFEIGRRMRQICEERGIPNDIEWSEDKRIYGDAWFEFIASCRANLGSEAGSNVFDFDGKIEKNYKRLSAARGGPVSYEEFRVCTDPIEAQYDIGQVSPRLFEAAAMRTPMILFSGRYLGVIEPDTHYIELKTDFSNVDAVLARLDDLEGLERMADRAYDRLVGSGEFSHRRYIELIDRTIARKAQELGLTLRTRRKEVSFPEFVSSAAQLADPREKPTLAPHDGMRFFCRHLARENLLYRNEIARLNAIISSGKFGSIPSRIVRKLTSMQWVREAGRAFLARLPAGVSERMKANLTAFFSRL